MITSLLVLLLLFSTGLPVNSELHNKIGVSFTSDSLAEDSPSYYSFGHESQEYSFIRGGGNSCYSHKDCQNCTKTSDCHWCEHDQKCHVVGSVYGCVTGAKCGNDDKNKKNNTNRDSCQKYPSCIECDATRTCHWCAHDESCHTVGSFYGCVRGVTCFDEDRCRRKHAEPMPQEWQTFTNMGIFPLVLVAVIASLAFCCASSCICFACGVKGAYDDVCGLIASRSNNQANDVLALNRTNDGEDANQHRSSDVNATRQPGSATAEEILEGEIDLGTTATTSDTERTREANPTIDERNEGDRAEEALEEERTSIESVHQSLEEQQHQEEQARTPLLQRPPNAIQEQETLEVAQESKHARRMLCLCTCLFFLFVLTIGGLALGAIRFFPAIPEYSVCNDGVQWRKLFGDLATLHEEVDFEILMSIENANHLGVVLDKGEGIFKHNGDPIGHYTVPPVEAPAMAISDVLVMATLTPGSREAVSLAKEYYEGTLVLHIDANLDVRAPSLFNFSSKVKITDRPIQINRDEDRHLCACKKWDNSTAHNHGLEFLHTLLDSGLQADSSP